MERTYKVTEDKPIADPVPTYRDMVMLGDEVEYDIKNLGVKGSFGDLLKKRFREAFPNFIHDKKSSMQYANWFGKVVRTHNPKPEKRHYKKRTNGNGPDVNTEVDKILTQFHREFERLLGWRYILVYMTERLQDTSKLKDDDVIAITMPVGSFRMFMNGMLTFMSKEKLP